MSSRNRPLIKLPNTLVPPAIWAQDLGGGDDPRTMAEKLARAFTDFKAHHTGQISALQNQLKDNSHEIEDLARRIAASTALGGSDQGRNVKIEMRAFADFARTGVRAAMSTDSNPDGGFTIGTTLDSAISEVSRVYSPMRSLATIVQLGQGAGRYLKPVRVGAAAYEWGGETTVRNQTAHSPLAQIEPPEGEITAMPAVTQWLLDDSNFDIGSELAGDISRSFATGEGTAFISGNGVNKPRGLLAHDKVAVASWAWGKLGFVVSGASGGFISPTTAASPADCLIDVIYNLAAPYRANASWLMNSATAGVVRKFKDSEGRFAWIDSIAQGQPPLLLGYPVAIDENMPDVASGEYPIAFGDFRSGYVIVDRLGTRVLRDPYSSKPFVLFYTTKRVGGCVQNYEAIRLLKIST